MAYLQLAFTVFLVEVLLSGDSSLSIGAMVMAIRANSTPHGVFKHPWFGDTRRLAVLLGVILAIGFRFGCLILLWFFMSIVSPLVVSGLLIVCSCYLVVFVSGRHFRDHFRHREESSSHQVRNSFAIVLLSIVMLDFTSSVDNLVAIIGTSRDLATDLIGMGGGMIFTLLFGSSLILKWINKYPSVKHAGFILLVPIALSIFIEGMSGLFQLDKQFPVVLFFAGDTIKYISVVLVLLLVMLYELCVKKKEYEDGYGQIVWIKPLKPKDNPVADGNFNKETGELHLSFRPQKIEGSQRKTAILVPANREESPRYCRVLGRNSNVERFVQRLLERVARTDSGGVVTVFAYACVDENGTTPIHLSDLKRGDTVRIPHHQIPTWGESVDLTLGIKGALKFLAKPGVDFIDLIVRVTSFLDDDFLAFLDEAAIGLAEGDFEIDGVRIPKFKIRFRYSSHASTAQMQKLDNYSQTRQYGFDFVDARPETERTEFLFDELLQESSVPIGHGQILIDGRNYWQHEQLTQSVSLVVPPRTKRLTVVLQGIRYDVRINR